MNSSVIHAEALSKEYHRGLHADAGLRHALDRAVKAPWSLFRRRGNEAFWALRDVSLDVHEGEVLGLIGRNGAGKTTLLKILSRITRPTSGWAEIHGRVGSLLEVGTGFHPELTGRENTFLSGAILGMAKAEINRKFDEIVAFAELAKFIDTPVKHYSSGMYVRLAFAVAAHLEPEILLVDEVLAVGDINFQKKCLGKMGDVARAGRTVMLVTHQLNQIRRLCHRVIWIDAGSVRRNGPPHEVCSAYESDMARGVRSGSVDRRVARSKARFVSWEIADCVDGNPHTLAHTGPTTIRFCVDVREHLQRAIHGVALFNHDQQLIWGTASYGMDLRPGIQHFVYSFPSLPLRPGPYNWQVSLFDDSGELDMWSAVPDMVVVTENYQHPRDEWTGILNVPGKLSIEMEPENND
jgi:lipopolysaccharide transport system ATP-binding protein